MAQVTLVPFANLPACVRDCGVLYDVNGGCVPPAKPQGDAGTYTGCFCADPRLAILNQGVSGVCDAPCAANPAALTSVRDWYTSLCANAPKPGGTTTGGNAPGQTTTSAGGSGGNPVNAVDPNASGDWLSGHWQWVVFIVVVVLGIAGIWVGACIWRRRYLRKKDRQYALGKALGHPGNNRDSAPSVHMPQAGMFNPANLSSANVYDMDPQHSEKKKWGGFRRNH